jgi:hypothetical protein
MLLKISQAQKTNITYFTYMQNLDLIKSLLIAKEGLFWGVGD